MPDATMAKRIDGVETAANLQRSLERMLRSATDRGATYATSEHLLLALTEDSEARESLAACRVDIERLQERIAEHLDRNTPRGGARPDGVVLSDSLEATLREAAGAAREAGRTEITSHLVLAAIVGKGQSAAAELLKSEGFDFDAAIDMLTQASLQRRAPTPAPPPAPLAPPVPVEPETKPQAPAVAAPVRSNVVEESSSTAVQPHRPDAASVTDAVPTPDAQTPLVSEAPLARGAASPASTQPGRRPLQPLPVRPQRPSRPPIRTEERTPVRAASPPAPPKSVDDIMASMRQIVDGGKPSAPLLPREPLRPEPSEPTLPTQPSPPPARSAPPTVTAPPTAPTEPVGIRPPEPRATPAAPPRLDAPLAREPRAMPVAPPRLDALPPRDTPPPRVEARAMPHVPPAATAPPAIVEEDGGGVFDLGTPLPEERISPPPVPTRPRGDRPPQREPHFGDDWSAPGTRPVLPGAPPPQAVRPPTPESERRPLAESPRGSRDTSGSERPRLTARAAPRRPQLAPVPSAIAPLDTARLAASLPRNMVVDVGTAVEVRVPRQAIEPPAVRGADRQPRPIALTARLRAPDGDLWIEHATAETQWLADVPGLAPQDDAFVWRWIVTPKERGRTRLLLTVSSRTLGPDGMPVETAMPDQISGVRVRPRFGRMVASTGRFLVAVGLGVGLAFVAGPIFQILRGLLKF